MLMRLHRPEQSRAGGMCSGWLAGYVPSLYASETLLSWEGGMQKIDHSLSFFLSGPPGLSQVQCNMREWLTHFKQFLVTWLRLELAAVICGCFEGGGRHFVCLYALVQL